MCLRNDECVCGKKINEDKYVSKGKTDYCSNQCANKHSNDVDSQKPSVLQQYTGGLNALASS